MGKINFFLFSNFWFTQAALWFGIFISNKRKKKLPIRETDNIEDFKYKNQRLALRLLYFLAFIFFTNQILIYITTGIPLFMESRLSAFENTNLGFLGRIQRVIELPIWILAWYNVFNKKYSFSSFFILLLCFCILIFSGSRSAFMIVPMSLFLYGMIFNLKIVKSINKYTFTLLLSFCLFAMLIYCIQNRDENPFLLLINRLISCGDVFYQGYPLNDFNKINTENILGADFLGAFRIRPWTSLPRPLGMQLFSINYGYDASMGANARHNFLGVLCFGFLGSVIFSFILGWIIGFFRKKFLSIKANDDKIIGKILWTIFYVNACNLETDATMFISFCVSFIITCIFITPLAILTFKIKIRYVTTKIRY
jgi:hypothetical protein